MKKYFVVRLPKKYHQITLEEFLDLDYEVFDFKKDKDTLTRTYEVDEFSKRIRSRVDVYDYIEKLENFNKRYGYLLDELEDHYDHFPLPKKTGGYRKIDAPTGDLKKALQSLKRMFEDEFGVMWHTAAYAYTKKRCCKDVALLHQQNKSRWFLKTDFSDFFGSTTLEFTMQQMERIFPFALICETQRGRKALENALKLGFLNGGLPQGTPLSPTLTNIIMIPIDFKLTKRFRERRMIYTRYADDSQISCKWSFKFMSQIELINDVLKEENAPYRIKKEKTKYGSNAGSNWILGVMLNKDNQITIGYKNKKRFETTLFNFGMDYKNGKVWELGVVQHLKGDYSYYKSIEGDTIDAIVKHISNKVGIDIETAIMEVLRS